MKVTQLRFEGFLKTPTLWEATPVYELTQFEIEQKSIGIDIEIDTKLRLGKYVERFVSHQLANTESISLIQKTFRFLKIELPSES